MQMDEQTGMNSPIRHFMQRTYKTPELTTWKHVLIN